MSSSEHLAKVADAADKFKDSVISSRKIGDERYNYTKNKKSQADGSTANVVVIKDKGAGTQYTISVNVSAVTFADGKIFTSDDRLDVLQAAVSKFLESIHEEL